MFSAVDPRTEEPELRDAVAEFRDDVAEFSDEAGGGSAEPFRRCVIGRVAFSWVCTLQRRDRAASKSLARAAPARV